MTELIGFAAALISTCTFLPQALRCWRTRQTRDISLPTYLLLCAGNAAWIVYGFARADVPIVLTNSIVGITGLSIVWLKLRETPAQDALAVAEPVASPDQRGPALIPGNVD